MSSELSVLPCLALVIGVVLVGCGKSTALIIDDRVRVVSVDVSQENN